MKGPGARRPTDGVHGIEAQPGGASTELTHVTSRAHHCDFVTPDLPAGGKETITLGQYRTWEGPTS